ncbi:MAG: efflux RND transporter periplasmic adaptor subunit [Dictyoglomus sp.]|nr:efflux RND transporter periplasmic adaptor subunit [Dictyoglomus sp.]MCX7942450.1 efflux RND transporter periplasmic adaptor subunit [Dictyoglomaceae bacterium]MDW8189285.1 efflux RND transporter periplasmic adaptor subunit [Dictyoglomus sp.]
MKKAFIILGVTFIALFSLLYILTDIFTPPIEVKALSVEKKNLPIIISTTGNLYFMNKVDINPKISGTLLKLRVKVGDKVKKGEILAEIDAKDIKKQIDNLKLIMKTLETQETLQNQFKILGSLFGFSQENSQEYINIFENLKNILSVYYENLRNMYENRLIKSPISGIVVNINAEEGQIIKEQFQFNLNFSNLNSLNLSSLLNLFYSPSSSTPLMTIVDTNSLVADVRVDESNVLKIKEGQKAEIRVEALGDRIWEGRVKSISFSPSISKDGSYGYNVKISIPALGDKVKEGMSVSADIYVGIKKNALVIPMNSIIFREGKTFVFIVNNNHAIEKEVFLGDIHGDMIEVVKGLEEKDTIILSPSNKLKNGSRVKINENFRKF